jgi:hypothetical protein
MALLVLRSVDLCVGKNQMCHFVRLAFRVGFLSVYDSTVGRPTLAFNGLVLWVVRDFETIIFQFTIKIFLMV